MQIGKTVTSNGEKGYLMSMLWGFLLTEFLWEVYFSSIKFENKPVENWIVDSKTFLLKLSNVDQQDSRNF